MKSSSGNDATAENPVVHGRDSPPHSSGHVPSTDWSSNELRPLSDVRDFDQFCSQKFANVRRIESSNSRRCRLQNLEGKAGHSVELGTPLAEVPEGVNDTCHRY